jgi:glucosyl-dolichyl phosphate glucuronosyltransferase
MASDSRWTLSVVICTYQRAASLARTLDSVVAQGAAADAEVLVVDNGSADGTRDVVRQYRTVRYIREPRLGLCHARNRGWREAAAPIVAFLDDDAVAAAGWVAAVLSAFADGDPTVGCVGGPVVPEWEVPAPAWMSRDVSLALAIVDWPGGTRRLTNLDDEWLAGANLACRVPALQAVNGFQPRLDRRGARLLSSGDVFLERQLVRRGYACVYEPAMRVHHLVAAERLTRAWFRRRYFWQGVSDALMNVIEHSPGRAERLRDAGRRGRTLLVRPRQLAALFRDTEDPREFEEQCWNWIAIGHVAGLLGAGGA